jgi:hypothetical protein
VPVELLASAEELRLWLGLAADDEDSLSDELAEMALQGPSRAVLSYCRRSRLVSGTDTVRLAGGVTILILPGAPVTDVAQVLEDPDGAAVDITSSVDWTPDGLLSRFDGGYFARRHRWYEVTFTHGYEDIPEDVRNVVLRVAARAVSNPEGLATEGVGGYNAGFAFDETRLPTLSAPDRRELDPYRL